MQPWGKGTFFAFLSTCGVPRKSSEPLVVSFDTDKHSIRSMDSTRSG